jgi:hypothetical protein
METTTIDATRTAAEIVSELVSAGATSINTDYKDGAICGLRWVMKVHGTDVVFDMPVRVDPVFNLFQKRRSYPRQYATQDREQAVRVAWRQLLRWVQAQNAMIETGMVEAGEVYMPYMIDNSGQTFFKRLSESRFKLLEAPVSDQ